VSFVSALSRAAKNGVLVKGGAYFDIATRVNHIAVDKTGTLTTGNPSVTEIVTFEDAQEDEVLAIAYALEVSSTHPLARAIVSEAERRGTAMPSVQNVEEVAGHGMRGMVDGWRCAVGKVAFMREEGNLMFQTDAEAERLGYAGATTVAVARGGEVVGIIGIADTLRVSVLEVLHDLREDGARCLEMLTGDNTYAAMTIAAQAGIDEVSAELLPSDKYERIKKLQDEGAVVAMVGDGINDAPALAAADIGITMGAAASDTALEVADVALLSDSLEQLPMFFRLAVRTMNIVRENICVAIGVKALVFVLVVMGVAGMGAAVFADTGVALLVILNGMRLMRASRLSW
jgi:Cd2+/Zn2+-exporting ATPase